MRARGTLVVLAVATAALAYGACTETRYGPISGADASVDVPDDGPDTVPDHLPEAGGPDATRPDGAAVQDAADANVNAWPCPAPSDAGTLLDREWMTGPLPPSSPGAGTYAMKPGTVCDRTTLLEWERTISIALRTWDQANAYCDSLLLEGTNDWRLPTRIELLTIVDFGRKSPAIDPAFFPGTPSSEFWSATLMSNVFSSPNAYYVSFALGYEVPYTKTEPFSVRCVRGGR